MAMSIAGYLPKNRRRRPNGLEVRPSDWPEPNFYVVLVLVQLVHPVFSTSGWYTGT